MAIYEGQIGIVEGELNHDSTLVAKANDTHFVARYVILVHSTQKDSISSFEKYYHSKLPLANRINQYEALSEKFSHQMNYFFGLHNAFLESEGDKIVRVSIREQILKVKILDISR